MTGPGTALATILDAVEAKPATAKELAASLGLRRRSVSAHLHALWKLDVFTREKLENGNRTGRPEYRYTMAKPKARAA